MIIDEFWKKLQGYGVNVPADVRRRVGLDLNQERIFVRPPAMSPAKARVVAAGTSMSCEVVARQAGVSVRYVQQIRRVLRANNSS